MAARRFLAPGGRAGNGHGFYSQPQRPLPKVADEPDTIDRIRDATSPCDEPEYLDQGDYDRHIDPQNVMREGQRIRLETVQREQARRLMNFEERIVTAQAEARSRCIDVSSEVRLLRHMQQSGKQVRHLETRLGVVERKVWRDAA